MTSMQADASSWTEANIPSHFRAWQYSSSKGGLEANLRLNEHVPMPALRSGENLVQIFASGLNPVDYKVAENQLALKLIPKPATPGLDYVGRLVKPSTSSLLKAGDIVFGMAGTGFTAPFAGGALAEYAVVSDEGAVLVPSGVDLAGAAVCGVAALTAYQSIQPHVKEGDKIFLNGGSGGVGLFGIQVGKALGCHVTVTCSTTNVELCRSLGADTLIDYTKDDVITELTRGNEKPTYKLAVDNVGGRTDLYYESHRYLVKSGSYIIVAGQVTLKHALDSLVIKLRPAFLGGGKRKVSSIFAKPIAQDYMTIATWMKQGKVKAIIDARFDYDQAPEAFRKLKSGHAKGKTLVTVNADAFKAAQQEVRQ